MTQLTKEEAGQVLSLINSTLVLRTAPESKAQLQEKFSPLIPRLEALFGEFVPEVSGFTLIAAMEKIISSIESLETSTRTDDD